MQVSFFCCLHQFELFDKIVRNYSSFEPITNAGATCKQLQHHFGWRNPNTALEYLANSEPQQLNMAKLITGCQPSG
jgi:hypothetical protein